MEDSVGSQPNTICNNQTQVNGVTSSSDTFAICSCWEDLTSANCLKDSVTCQPSD